MNDRFLMIHTSVLPDIFEKVIEVKELMKTGKVREITEAVKVVGISRSTYYKYKDFVFTVTGNMNNHKVIIALTLDHEPGTLSRILDNIAYYKGNILTINQEIPINNTANVNITFDISNLKIEFNKLLDEIKNMDHVIKLELVAMD
ncbi:ACT domain-containing protein [uncultured Clostridium sp.]|uniref:ACT domain-containing protein n=1 Tax=uncultured Clostridium sp. TaxID=59620 RepID=UPI0028EF4DA4|nr:ACT domain-containing protein [uncultured Clostridium sp.]